MIVPPIFILNTYTYSYIYAYDVGQTILSYSKDIKISTKIVFSWTLPFTDLTCPLPPLDEQPATGARIFKAIPKI
jgi:hypothetical protein